MAPQEHRVDELGRRVERQIVDFFQTVWIDTCSRNR